MARRQKQDVPQVSRTTLPSTRQDWERLLSSNKESNVTDTMWTIKTYKSASKMLDHQYLMLRVLWSSNNASEFDESQWPNAIRQYQRAAAALLRESSHWQRYIQNLPELTKSRKPGPPYIGLFTIPRWHQLTIVNIDQTSVEETSSLTPQRQLLEQVVDQDNQRAVAELAWGTPIRRRPQRVAHVSGKSSEATPSGISTDPRIAINHAAEDEQVVNTALILLLDALLMLSPQIGVETTIKRERFNFGGLWVACTDGCIRDFGNPTAIRAIIEVKAFNREKKAGATRQQEAGEMASWIHADHNDHGIMSTRIADVTLRDKSVVRGVRHHQYVSDL